VTPDRLLVSRDMGDSPPHVETPGCRSEGRLSPVVRHGRGRFLRHQSRPPAPALRRYREGGLEAVEPRSRRPHASPQRTSVAVRDRIVALRTELVARAWTPAPPPSPGTSSARASEPPQPRRSAASSLPQASSHPSPTSARAVPGSGSRPPRRTRSGSPTSPTGASPTGARSRSSTGSTTTPATCSPARSSIG